MKLKSLKPSILKLTIAVTLSGLPLNSHAAALTWDITPGDGATITDGSGTWTTGAGNWNTAGTDANWANGDTAVFNGASRLELSP